jgi:hypothetical protein
VCYSGLSIPGTRGNPRRIEAKSNHYSVIYIKGRVCHINGQLKHLLLHLKETETKKEKEILEGILILNLDTINNINIIHNIFKFNIVLNYLNLNNDLLLYNHLLLK